MKKSMYDIYLEVATMVVSFLIVVSIVTSTIMSLVNVANAADVVPDISSEPVVMINVMDNQFLYQQIAGPAISRVPQLGINGTATQAITEPIIKPEPTPPPFVLREHFGEDVISDPSGRTFTELDLPSKYYPGIDFSYFKAWMPYTVLGKNNQCGRIAYSDRAFTDENGLRRYTIGPDEYNVNGQADYLVAMGTFYKDKGTVGQRYLIVTPSGSYTVKTSDELADAHSDSYNMFSWHGKYACVLEFLVDRSTLARSAKQMGTVSAIGGLLGEDIIHIYMID